MGGGARNFGWWCLKLWGLVLESLGGGARSLSSVRCGGREYPSVVRIGTIALFCPFCLSSVFGLPPAFAVAFVGRTCVSQPEARACACAMADGRQPPVAGQGAARGSDRNTPSPLSSSSAAASSRGGTPIPQLIPRIPPPPQSPTRGTMHHTGETSGMQMQPASMQLQAQQQSAATVMGGAIAGALSSSDANMQHSLPSHAAAASR